MMKLAQVTAISGTTSHFDNYQTLPALLFSRILPFAMGAAGLYFFYQITQCGFSYMGSMGDPAKLQNIQKQLWNATLGLIAVIASFFILQIIQTMTGANLI